MKVAHRVSETLSRTSNRFKPLPPDLRRGFHHFLALFRAGYFGKICLDNIPNPDMLQRRGDVLDSLRFVPELIFWLFEATDGGFSFLFCCARLVQGTT